MPRVYRPGQAMKPCRTALGQFIRDHRLQLGLTQRHLDQLAWLGQRKCARLEEGNTGHRYLNQSQQDRLSQVLECDREELRLLATRPCRHVQTELGRFVSSHRDGLGVTQVKFAKLLNCHQGTISRIETGRWRAISSSTAEKLREVLRVLLTDLVPFLSKGKIGRHMSPTNSGFGQAIRSRRLELGMTLREVANRAGCSRQAISLFELGRVPLNRGTKLLDRLAETLKLDHQELRGLVLPRKMNRTRERPTPLAQLLTDRRKMLGLTQAALARLAGVSGVCISQLENGKIRLPDRLRLKLEDALQCPLPTELSSGTPRTAGHSNTATS